MYDQIFLGFIIGNIFAIVAISVALLIYKSVLKVDGIIWGGKKKQ